MKKITWKDLQKLNDAELHNIGNRREKNIERVSTDSRTAGNGTLFIAIRGERFDAHEFIPDVSSKGVSAIIAQKQWVAQHRDMVEASDAVFVAVPDTITALGQLAQLYRKKFDIPLIAIGGSNGKTTTKEMVTAILRTKYSVLSTEGNLNNHIGVPQTLFRLSSEHDAAVVELGTNHPGEMKYLCGIAEPTHGLITNIGKEHLEFFTDEQGVADEETELFRYLEKTNGRAFVNMDDQFLQEGEWKFKKVITYGTSSKADIRAKKIEVHESGNSSFQCVWRKKEKSLKVNLSVPGVHSVTNALAAAAVGLQMNVKENKITQALNEFTSASKRMEAITYNDIMILNDTYNSNPDSVIAALQTLQAIKTKGRKIVVFGDMKELGESSKREHANIGAVAAGMKYARLFTIGPFSKYTSEMFGNNAEHFESKDELARRLKEFVRSGDIVLVKGSRGMKMEEIVSRMTEDMYTTETIH